MICAKCGYDDQGTGDSAHYCSRKPHVVSEQITKWLATDEGKLAIAESIERSQNAIAILNKAREINLADLNVPMTDFSRYIQPVPSAEPVAVYEHGSFFWNRIVDTSQPVQLFTRPAEDAQSEEILELLDLMFDKYEKGTDCYEDPEDCAGHLGVAIKLDDATFHRIADILNARRPRDTAMAKEGK